MPPSVSTPSTSNPTSRIRRATAASSTDRLPRRAPDVQHDLEDARQAVERKHVRSIARRVGRIRVSLDEEAVGTGGSGRIEQWGDEFAQAAARAVRALPRLL